MLQVQSKCLLCKSSPKQAFYNLVLAGTKVLKVSGTTYPIGRILDRRVFNFQSPGEAEKFYSKKIREKVQGNRERVYEDIDFCLEKSGTRMRTIPIPV